MKPHGNEEGGPEQRRRQFEDERGLSDDRPALPLDESKDEPDAPPDGSEGEESEKEDKEKKEGGGGGDVK
jgi:hypothetical protein